MTALVVAATARAGSSEAAAPLPPLGRSLLPLSRDAARDETAIKLAEAGFPETLRGDGLVLWHILRARTRSGERLFLTVSLPSDGRPFERGADDPERRALLLRRLDAAEGRIVSEAARILAMPEDMVGVSGRLIESCCGAGCQSCLLAKEQHAKRWTGLPLRATEDSR